MFDFSKNEFSESFTSSCYSATHFVERFNEIGEKAQYASSIGQVPTMPIDVGDIDVNDTSKTTGGQVEKAGTKRKLQVTLPDLNSPPVPKKKNKSATGMGGRNDEGTTLPDVNFLEDVKKYAVPGKLIVEIDLFVFH